MLLTADQMFIPVALTEYRYVRVPGTATEVITNTCLISLRYVINSAVHYRYHYDDDNTRGVLLHSSNISQ